VEKVSVLIVDDEKNIRRTLRVCIESLGGTVGEAPTAEVAVDAVGRTGYDIAFLDLKLGTDSGLDLIPRLLAEQPSLAIVVITAFGTIETAVEAMRRGAWDYLPKPFTPAQIRHILERIAQQRTLAQYAANLEGQLRTETPDILTTSSAPSVRALLDTVARTAPTDAAMLFRGESGTGKGVLARVLHQQSKRRDGPFVLVNCPTLSDELLASDLFGHARGAFTGAVRDQVGRVEAAQGGTLFLDESGELPAHLQAKLLRFLQEKQFERIGETRTRQADVRLISEQPGPRCRREGRQVPRGPVLPPQRRRGDGTGPARAARGHLALGPAFRGVLCPRHGPPAARAVARGRARARGLRHARPRRRHHSR
jgi:NtrC-family two-component system response regulator AlgB